MNSRWKKVLSLLLALSIVCSLAVVPAGAAGENLTVSFENGAWSGQQYKVDVTAKGTGSFNAAVAAITVNFDKDVLTFAGAEDKTGFQMVVAPNVSSANEKGSFNLGPTDVNGKTFASTMPIATLTFQLKSGVENQDTSLTFGDVAIQDNQNQAYTLTASPATVTITNGALPTLGSVEHKFPANNITVNGGAVVMTAKAAAKSTKGADISASVTWSVSPADGGVTVDESGTVSVSPTAKAGSYQITAAPIEGKSQGEAKSVSIGVTRAPSEARSIAVFQNGTAITGDTATIIKPTAGKTNTYTYTAKVVDQFGDELDGTVSWVLGSTDEGVTLAGNVVTVADSATVGSTVKLGASVGTFTKTINLTVKDINITWPTPAVKAGAVYGDAWNQIVTLSGGSAELNGERVSGAFTVKGASEYPAAGEQTYTINFKSSDGQYDVDSAAQTAEIAKRPVTIKMKDQRVSYGDTFQYYQFDTVVTGKPLLFSDTVTATASGSAKGDGTDAVGTYKIHGTASHANYAVTVEDGTLTIAKKAVAPAEKVPALTVVGTVKKSVDETGRTVITGTVEASAAEARSLEALLKALLNINPDMVPGVTRFTITAGGSDVTFTFQGWKLASGQTFDGPGAYEIVPEWKCSDPDAAKNYEPSLPRLVVEVEGKTETLTVNDGRTWTLYISDVEDAKYLDWLLPDAAYYKDGTRVEILRWKYADGTAVTLSNFRSEAKKGGSIRLYPVVSPSYLEVESLYVRFIRSSGSSGTVNGGSSGGGHMQITLDPEKIFLNGDLPNDVSRDYWAAPYISWAYQRGVMNGTGNGNFSPNGLTSRQQLWMVLARLSGEKPIDMAAARAWAVRTGVSDGTNPGGSLTRQQLVAMLYRYAQLRGCDVSASGGLSSYKDVRNVSSYARQAMAWAVGQGIVTGTADLRLNPQGTASRSHFAAMMFRFCAKYNV